MSRFQPIRFVRSALPLAMAVFLSACAANVVRADLGDIYAANFLDDNVSYYDGVTGEFKGIFVNGMSGGLDAPTGIDFGLDNNLYVSSSMSNEILRFDSSTGSFIDVFASGGSLDRPFSLIFSGTDMYVSSQQQVLRYDGTTGQFLNIAASGNGLSTPIGLAVGPNGNLFIANSGADNVLEFDPITGQFVSIFATSSELDLPTDVVFGTDGNLYVSSGINSKIVRFDAVTGDFVDVFGVLPDQAVPVGIAFGLDGQLLSGDFSNNRLFRFDINGSPNLLSDVGLGGPENIAVMTIQSVPEPTSLVVLLGCLIPALFRRQRSLNVSRSSIFSRIF